VSYAPVLGQLHRALRGGGAYANDRRIRVSDVADLSESLLCYSSVSWFRRAGREAAFLELAAKTQRQRGYGDYFGFVLVAEGAVEVMVEHGVHPWDVAATKAIVEEAGGTFTDWDGTPTIDRPDVLASNGRVHRAVLDILKK
jgi:histidinol-phosphatase